MSNWYRVEFSGRPAEGHTIKSLEDVEDWLGVGEKLAEAFGFETIDSIKVTAEPST